jgi:importin subunit alpha-6/7
MIYLQYIV